VDDAAFPSGEIRGQLTIPLGVPALSVESMALLSALLACAGVARQRIHARSGGRRARDV
jgi:hypothetical protein